MADILSEGGADFIAICAGAGTITPEQIEQLFRSHAALHGLVDKLIEGLNFYADPDTYVAIGFFPDRPCGDFMHDFSEVEDDFFDRPMPGKAARDILSGVKSEVIQWPHEVTSDSEDDVEAVYQIGASIIELLRKREFANISMILTDLPEKSTAAIIMMGRVVFPYRTLIPGWADYLKQARDLLAERGDDADKLMGGLL